ncbi:hypothetical protein C0J52_25263 [Blattella germanica]|nr:hypothetical protein C0J52_25263 [Blattella germanica]
MTPYSLCDYYLWGTLKNRVYRINPHNIDELKDNIRTEIRIISEEELLRIARWTNFWKEDIQSMDRLERSWIMKLIEHVWDALESCSASPPTRAILDFGNERHARRALVSFYTRRENASFVAILREFPGQNYQNPSDNVGDVLFPEKLIKSEHKDERLIFVVGSFLDWKRRIFTDKVGFSTSNEGPVFVYRPLGSRYAATSARRPVMSCAGCLVILTKELARITLWTYKRLLQMY